MRKVVLYIAMSLDGYIAGPDDDLGFLSAVEQQGEDYGYGTFIKTVDTVLVGRKTYDKVLSMVNYFPHAKDKEVFILTRTPRPAEGSITFYSGELAELIEQLKSKEGKNIFVDGGAEVVQQLLAENLIDEMYISVIPVLLGAGIPLFRQGLPQQPLQLQRATAFEKGLVQLHYLRA